MSDEEMEAELDAIEAEEDEYDEYDEDEDEVDSAEPGPDPVDLKLQRVQELRDVEDEAGARGLLYQVLEEGNDEQRKVARNILEQLDT